jgi:sec-independent protein translocase protein TatA
MFGISFEHIIVLGIILLVVGPRRLPELGNTMGKAIKNFKDSFSGIEEASFKRVNEQNQTSAPVAESVTTASTAKKVPTVNPSSVNPSSEANI